VYVTHDQEEALTMSDRIAVMSKGVVQQMGTPVEIYERPANKFVADFIGESNFLEGKLKSVSGDEANVFVPALNMEIRALPISAGLVKGEEVVISIRPEKIRITEKDAKAENLFQAVVKNTVYIGADTHIYVDARGIKLKVMEQNHISRLDTNSFYHIGQEIGLMLMPENTLVLKKDA
jgi:ABC-type Fe3+/spermidine/putrescine transport system ATPase subunit